MHSAQNWSPAINALYDQGIRVLYVFGKDTAENRAKLTEACRNVESIEKTELRLEDLLEACALAEYTGKVWSGAQKQLSGLFKRTHKLQLDTHEYGWSPFARVLLTQKYRRLKRQAQKEVPENDSMDRFLRENCTLGMTSPDPTEELDPMELILNGEW